MSLLPLFAAPALGFGRRARADAASLPALFGAPYRDDLRLGPIQRLTKKDMRVLALEVIATADAVSVRLGLRSP